MNSRPCTHLAYTSPLLHALFTDRLSSMDSLRNDCLIFGKVSFGQIVTVTSSHLQRVGATITLMGSLSRGNKYLGNK